MSAVLRRRAPCGRERDLHQLYVRGRFGGGLTSHSVPALLQCGHHCVPPVPLPRLHGGCDVWCDGVGAVLLPVVPLNASPPHCPVYAAVEAAHDDDGENSEEQQPAEEQRNPDV